jgi:hypothetical protein
MTSRKYRQSLQATRLSGQCGLVGGLIGLKCQKPVPESQRVTVVEAGSHLLNSSWTRPEEDILAAYLQQKRDANL